MKGVDLYIEALAERGRDAEKAAVLKLVERAFGSDAIYSHDPAGAPLIKGIDSAVHISVSHCRTCAALAVSDRPVGIDVETEREQLQRVAPRVLSADELEYYGDRLLQAWTLKEALYKASHTPGLDFRANIHLPLDGGSCARVDAWQTQSFDIVKSEYLPDYGAFLSVVVGC